MRFYLNIGPNAPINISLLTYNGKTAINVTNGIEGRSLPERLFDLLRSHGRK